MMRWYAVYTRPHDETRALDHLLRQGYVAYLPRYRTRISHARRHQTVLRPLLTDVLSERQVRESGVFEWTAVEEIVRKHLERRANLGYHLWGLLTLFLWMKRWNIRAPSHTPTPVSSSSQ